MVSCLSRAIAIAILVPTPSVLVASSGLRKSRRRAHVEQAGESADAAEHLGPVGAADRRLHEFDGAVTGRGVDACLGVAVGAGHGSSVWPRAARPRAVRH